MGKAQARVAELEREVGALRGAKAEAAAAQREVRALHGAKAAKAETEARLADKERRLEALRAEVCNWFSECLAPV